jgi:hypothetical protein
MPFLWRFWVFWFPAERLQAALCSNRVAADNFFLIPQQQGCQMAYLKAKDLCKFGYIFEVPGIEIIGIVYVHF